MNLANRVKILERGRRGVEFIIIVDDVDVGTGHKYSAEELEAMKRDGLSNGTYIEVVGERLRNHSGEKWR